MAVSKRTRFEILRRDEHTCQYCGAKAPEAVLHIDHVVPIALGGSDKPDNLVAACKDCNVGKASIQPDSPLVQRVGAEAAAYVLGMQDKMTRFRSDVESADQYIEEFDELWNSWKRGDEPNPLPADYELSLFRWHKMGVPFRVLELAVPGAMQKSNRERFMKPDAIFTYMAGIVWSMVNDREIDYSVTQDTAAVYTEAEADDVRTDAYDRGWEQGFFGGTDNQRIIHAAQDLLQHHIDGTEMEKSPNGYLTGRVVRRG